MKKALFTLILCTTSLVAMSQDYTHSVGLTVGGYNGVTYKGFIFGIDGLALQTDLAVRVSAMGVHGPTHVSHPGHHETDWSIPFNKSLVYYTFELNPNIIYQQPFAETSWGQFDWLAGGGFSLGMMDASTSWDMMGYNYVIKTTEYPDGTVIYEESKKRSDERLGFKFGLNAIGGIETSFSDAPLTLAIEFRLGYGLFARSSAAGRWDDQYGNPDPYASISSYSFFDWALGAALRYKF